MNNTEAYLYSLIKNVESNNQKDTTNLVNSLEKLTKDVDVLSQKKCMESINNTVKGTDIVNVTDNIEQKTSEITIYGNTTQTVTKGKNLFDPNIQMFDNKSINENGEIVENSDTKVTDYILMDKKGYYIISLNTQDASMCKVSLYNSDKSFLENKENFENGYIVLDITERRYMRLTIPTLANKIQLEFSEYRTRPSTYEPYTGGLPSPRLDYPQEMKSVGVYNKETGKYDIELKVVKRNLFNLTDNYLCGNIEGYQIIVSDTEAFVYIPCCPNTTYTIYGREVINPSVDTKQFIAQTEELPQSGTNIIRVDSAEIGEAITITTENTTRYILISVIANGEYIERSIADAINATTSRLMVILGEQKIPYEKYEEQIVKLSLDEPLRSVGKYRDILTKEGVIRNIGKVVFDRPGQLEFQGGYTLIFGGRPIQYAKGVSIFSSLGEVISDNVPYFFTMMNPEDGGESFCMSFHYPFIYEESPITILFPPTTSEMSQEAIDKMVAENPITVLYVMEEPTIESSPELIDELKKLEISERSVITVYTNNDCEIGITYELDVKKYIDNKFENVNRLLSGIQT